MSGPNKYVLDEDEHVDRGRAVGQIASFQVQQPLRAAGKPVKEEKQKKRTIDVFVGQDKEILSFEGFYSPWYKQVLFYFLGLCTFGLTFLLAKWLPKVYVKLHLNRCKLSDALYVRIKLVDGRESIHPVTVIRADDTQQKHPYLADGNQASLLEQAGWPTHQRLLEFRCHRYFFLDSLDTFVPVPDVPKGFNQQLQSSSSAMAAATAASTPGPAAEAAVAAALEDRTWDLADRQLRYGTNEMKIPVKSVLELVYNEMWHPFYVFQYFSILVWVAGDAYYTYAVCIGLITWFSIITGAVDTHQNMKRLARIAQYACKVQVLRNGAYLLADSADLVPGDIAVVDTGILPADMVLIRGECIVDENMLTGESVPVRKVAYSPVADGLNYDPDKHSACTLYGGTNVAQARAPVGQVALAMVVRTRFYSAKGQLLRSILFPREHSQSFISDSLKLIAVMLTACMGVFIWAAVVLVQVGAEPQRIVVRFFDMITVAVPPALPACLTIATVFSIGRLRKKAIYVTGPHTITVAGQLDIICFDKTGTLTEQGLELQAVVPVVNRRFEPASRQMEQLPPSLPQLLASCHGLARMGEVLVGDPLDQKLFAGSGWTLVDAHGQAAPAAEAAASAQSWVHPPNRPDQRSVVVRRFEFSSALQRNLVVLKNPPGAGVEHVVYAKGSPEMIRTLVRPASIPADFDKILAEYTREGLRVIALAKADVPAGSLPASAISSYTQQQLEQAVGLDLVGLAVLENPLRPDTTGVIEALQKAQVRTAMVTGDHLRTAISIAHQCCILPAGRPILLVDADANYVVTPSTPPGVAGAGGAPLVSPGSPLKFSVLYPDGSVNEVVQRGVVLPQVIIGELECAVTGKGFDALVGCVDAELLLLVLRRASVYARMSPDNKRDLMELLGNGLEGGAPGCPHLGLHVGFCGDGANDCGALKAADVGVSLCEAEASVAAPMTSRQQTIASMLTVVAEGRCALMATYQIFQFIVAYAMAQAFSTNLMYTYSLQMGNYQFLIQDLFYITILAALMGYTRPRQDLAKTKPMPRVLSLPLMLSLVLQIAVLIIFQLAALQSLHRVPWYTRSQGTPDLRTYVAPETTVIYLIGLSQFIILALVFNKGFPHRQPLWTNTGLLVSLVLQVGFLVYQLFSVDAFTTVVVQLVGKDPTQGLPMDYRAILLLIMVVNAAAALLMELVSGVVLLLIYKLREKFGWRWGGGKKEEVTNGAAAGVSLLRPPLGGGLEAMDSYASTASVGHGGRGLIGTAVAVRSPLASNGAALL